MTCIERLADIYNVTIQQTSLPGVRGLSHKCGDGYLILINQQLPHEMATRTLAHEIMHIIMGHFDEHSHKPESQKEQEVSAALDLLYGF